MKNYLLQHTEMTQDVTEWQFYSQYLLCENKKGICRIKIFKDFL